MPQEFHVLQCFSCQTFQVQQVKKALKWACKLCGEKQSILKVYGCGSGKDCRGHVQRLNTRRGEINEQRDSLLTAGESDVTSESANQVNDEVMISSHGLAQGHSNRWSQYLDAHVERSVSQQLDSDDDGDDDNHVTTDVQLFKSVKRQKQKSKRSHPYTAKSNTNSNQAYTKLPSSCGSNASWSRLSDLDASGPINNQSNNIRRDTCNQSVNLPENTINQSLFVPRHTSNQSMNISWDPSNQSTNEADTNTNSGRQLANNITTTSVRSDRHQTNLPSIPSHRVSKSKSSDSGLSVAAASNTSKWGQFLSVSVDNSPSSEDEDEDTTSMILSKGGMCHLGAPSVVDRAAKMPTMNINYESKANYEDINKHCRLDLYPSNIEPISDREKLDKQVGQLSEISSYPSRDDAQINRISQDMYCRIGNISDSFKENLPSSSNIMPLTRLESKSQVNINNSSVIAPQKNSSRRQVSGALPVHNMFQIEDDIEFDL